MINSDAKKVGVSKDIAWSNDGALAIVIELSDEEEAFLPFDEIEKIGDVVFIKTNSDLASVPTVTCPVCKHKNSPEAKFCAKCGRTLEPREEKREKRT